MKTVMSKIRTELMNLRVLFTSEASVTDFDITRPIMLSTQLAIRLRFMRLISKNGVDLYQVYKIAVRC